MKDLGNLNSGPWHPLSNDFSLDAFEHVPHLSDSPWPRISKNSPVCNHTLWNLVNIILSGLYVCFKISFTGPLVITLVKQRKTNSNNTQVCLQPVKNLILPYMYYEKIICYYGAV